MSEPEPKRLLWREKRWWAAAVLWLIVAYPFSAGPWFYCVNRGWCGLDPYIGFYTPLTVVTKPYPAVWRPIDGYAHRWHRLAARHEAAASG